MNIRRLIIILLLSIVPLLSFAPVHLEKGNPFDLAALMRETTIRNDKNLYRENYQKFKSSLAGMESSNDWTKYNPFGYIGKYQFGQDALEATGYGHVDFISFIENPSIFTELDQEKAMDRLLKLNEQVLRPYIRAYVGHIMLDSIKITRSGLMAAAHLAGPGNVKRFLESAGQFNPKDRMGTFLSDYLTKFGDLN